jgi:hypothetical protein
MYEISVCHCSFGAEGWSKPFFFASPSFLAHLCVNAGEKFPDFAGFRFPLLDKKIY